jgi:hypothetical protein
MPGDLGGERREQRVHGAAGGDRDPEHGGFWVRGEYVGGVQACQQGPGTHQFALRQLRQQWGYLGERGREVARAVQCAEPGERR